MDPSLLEQFLGPSSTQFQLPSLNEDENDELHPLLNVGFQRLTHTRKSLPARPKPPSSSGVKSRLNSDNGTSSRSRPAVGIPTRHVTASISAGK
ncbi:unnamed protein product [Rotaria sp. Silwood2]|nr:unnamed protein product [Rotaria sp. Silwood2]CAF2499373.1 unnamed protein product [Rotaria sp. Silwood2]CAF2897040.1 unnamed protein product [Rotaria sp. Silwood2]